MRAPGIPARSRVRTVDVGDCHRPGQAGRTPWPRPTGGYDLTVLCSIFAGRIPSDWTNGRRSRAPAEGRMPRSECIASWYGPHSPGSQASQTPAMVGASRRGTFVSESGRADPATICQSVCDDGWARGGISRGRRVDVLPEARQATWLRPPAHQVLSQMAIVDLSLPRHLGVSNLAAVLRVA